MLRPLSTTPHLLPRRLHFFPQIRARGASRSCSPRPSLSLLPLLSHAKSQTRRLKNSQASDQGLTCHHALSRRQGATPTDTHPTTGVVVVEVHQLARLLLGCLAQTLLLLSHVNEGLRKAIAVLDVVAASSPDPLLVHHLGSSGARAATVGELTVATGARDRVHDPSCGDRVCERRLPAGCVSHVCVCEDGCGVCSRGRGTQEGIYPKD